MAQPILEQSSALFDERTSLLRTHSNDGTNSVPHSKIKDDDTSLISQATLWQEIKHFEHKSKVLAVMFCFLTTGMLMTAIGALLPDIENYYNLNDTQASMIFPTAVVGYIFGTISLTRNLSRFGWRGMAITAPLLHLVAVATLSTGPPFVILLLAHFIAGLGTGHSDAGFCAWASKLSFPNVVQGLMHGSFSVGCILGPVICIAVQKNELRWYVYYWVLAVFAAVELVVLTLAYRNEGREQYAAAHQAIGTEDSATKATTKIKILSTCGLFYFGYMGVESSFTNWIPTYMKRVRHVDAATASLSSSMFWFGMALGRFMLGPVTEHFGLPLSVTMYIVLSTLLELAFKLVSNLSIVVIALGGCGLFLGPMFPSGILLLSQKLSMQEYVGGVAIAAAMGQIGGASAPLLVGFLADRFGLAHLTDVVLFCFCLLLIMWLLFCRAK